MQLDDLREFSGLRDWEIEGEYVDHGVSGAKERRPALDRLLDGARRRKFDVFLIWKLDRAARSTKHLLSLAEEFEALKIDFVSMTETIDTTSPSGKMIFTILGAVAQFERDLARERIRGGMRAAKARGKKFGRPRLDPTEEEQKELLELHRQGLSIRDIAKRVSWFPSNDGPARHPSPSLVHRWLKKLRSFGTDSSEAPDA